MMQAICSENLHTIYLFDPNNLNKNLHTYADVEIA